MRLNTPRPWVQVHLLFKHRGAGHENDNCVGLKLAKKTATALRWVYDGALGL